MVKMNGQVDMKKKISGVEPLYTPVYGFMESKDTLTARQQYSQHVSSWVRIPLKEVPLKEVSRERGQISTPSNNLLGRHLSRPGGGVRAVKVLWYTWSLVIPCM
ncbi:hypothetical protein B0T13DRAFT_134124 [Neurospora crassa]|nr:hypothetical protein B0T13DRAFT_134124 [Neurospora crassa]